MRFGGCFLVTAVLLSACSANGTDGIPVAASIDRPITQATTKGWMGLGAPANVALKSDPDACSWGPGNLNVVVIGTPSSNNGALWWKSGQPDTNGNGWNAWATLGYPNGTTGLKGNASCASKAPGQLDIFAIANDNNLWSISFNGTSWGSWQSLGNPSSEALLGVDVDGRQADQTMVMYLTGGGSIWFRKYLSGAWQGWVNLASRSSEQIGDVAGTADGPPCPAGYTCYAGIPNWFNRTYATGLSYINSYFNGSVGDWIGDPSPKSFGVDAAVDPKGRIHVVFLNQNKSPGVMIYDQPRLPSETQHNMPFIAAKQAPTIAIYHLNAYDTLGSEAIFVIGSDGGLWVNYQNPTMAFDETFTLAVHNSFIWRNSQASGPWYQGKRPDEVLDMNPKIRNLEIDLHITKIPSNSSCDKGRWGVWHSGLELGEYGVYNSNNCAWGAVDVLDPNAPSNQSKPPTTALRDWHNAHPNHEVFVVDVQMMHDVPSGAEGPGIDSGDHSAQDFDDSIAGLRSFLFTPADFYAICPAANGTLNGLNRALATAQCNWPTLEELRGKMMIVMHDNPGSYFSDYQNGRLAFKMDKGTLSTDLGVFMESGNANGDSPVARAQRKIDWWTDSGLCLSAPYFTGQGSHPGASEYNMNGWFSHGFGTGGNHIHPAHVFRADYEPLAAWNWSNPWGASGTNAAGDWGPGPATGVVGATLMTGVGFPYCPDRLSAAPSASTVAYQCWYDLPNLVENLDAHGTPNQERPQRGDTCASPKTIFEKSATSIYKGTTQGRANDFSGACGGSAAADEVYLLTLSQTKEVKINLAGSSYDTVLYIKSAEQSCPGGSDIACNDNNTTAGTSGYGTSQSYVDVTLPPGSYYVFVDGNGSSFGTYQMQVDILAPATNLVLLSQGKTATQSSTALGLDASRAVDGNVDGAYGDGSITHTNSDSWAWWKVDLGSTKSISSIDVYGRTDCCIERLTDLRVYTADSDAAPWVQVGYLPSGPGIGGARMTVNHTGKLVLLQIPGPNYMSLAEVKVWGTEVPSACGSAGSYAESWGALGAPGSVHGCKGHVTYQNRATLCGYGAHVCSATEWIYRPFDIHRVSWPGHIYWTNDNLGYGGSGSNSCSANTNGVTSCGANQPMRVCSGTSDSEGNACNWTGCGLNSTSAEYFGGCVGNAYAGALCCF